MPKDPKVTREIKKYDVMNMKAHEIAQLVGCSPSFVRSVRQELIKGPRKYRRDKEHRVKRIAPEGEAVAKKLWFESWEDRKKRRARERAQGGSNVGA